MQQEKIERTWKSKMGKDTVSATKLLQALIVLSYSVAKLWTENI